MADVKRTVKSTLEKDMIFKCDIENIRLKDWLIDETNKIPDDMVGPNAAHLLAMAILGCLNASYIFCLNKRDFTVDQLNAKAEVTIFRNEKGFLRVKKIDVIINPKIDTPEMRKRADQCKKMFEKYCTITASIREGIEVNVNIDY